MKKLLYLICLVALQSCSPSLQGFGWVAVVLPAAGGIYYGYIAILKSLTLRVSVLKINESVYALIGFVAAIGIYIAMQSAK